VSDEIERKWVLPAPPEQCAGTPAEPVRQGYLAVDERAEVRVRETTGERELTIKGGRGRARTEEHVAVDAEQFERLWALTEGRRIDKHRHAVALDDGVTATIDVYHGALEGLVTAEVEFDSEAAADAFEPPPWLGDEVTGDHRYANQALAVDGAPRPGSP